MNASTDRVVTDDVQLMAYVDGALTEAEAAVIAAAIERDAALAERVAMFHRTRHLAREALDRQLGAPVPPALRAAVEAMAAAQSAPATATVERPAAQTTRSSWLQWLRDGWANMALPTAVAASVLAGVVSYGIVSALQDGPPVLAVGDRASPALAGLLDKLPSGGQAVADRMPMAVIASFRDAGGALCRDFSLEPVQAPRVEAVACRNSTGQWDLRFASVAGNGAGGFAPAGAGSALDTYLASIGASQPLDAAAEAAALAGR
jgi:anti-sigma factor RsiW